MVKRISPYLARVLLWCAMAALLIWSAENVSALRQYSAVSLRYHEPFCGQTAYQLRKSAIERETENAFWPTFWHETRARVEVEFRTVEAPCILYSGDASLVWPAKYLSGAAPGVTDGTGCAISSALSQELWGGIDVVGKTIKVDGAERVVRGVFEGDQPLALLSFRDENTGQSFTAIELSGGPSSPNRIDAELFVMSAGLGRPDSILIGTPVIIASAMSALPLLILFVYLLARLLLRLRERPVVIYVVMFSLFFGIALFLPGILDALPSWVIPSRLSDFSFWGAMAQQIGDDLHEYLSLAPQMRDVIYTIQFYKQIGATFLSVICALSLCFQNTL